jgi:hypothetical protein
MWRADVVSSPHHTPKASKTSSFQAVSPKFQQKEDNRILLIASGPRGLTVYDAI